MVFKKALKKVCNQLVWPTDTRLDYWSAFGLFEIIFLLESSQHSVLHRLT